MFGLLNPEKILFTVIVVAIIWYGFKFMNRAQNTRRESVAREREASRTAKRQDDGIEDLSACAVCGDFVAKSSARNCGRGDCPFPG